MAEYMRAFQAACFLAADTIHIWRDSAVAALAGMVIACLWLFAEAHRA
jgi:hypothetical protein